MAIEALITVVPKNKINKVYDSSELPSYELSSEWAYIDCALQELGEVVGMALRGKYKPKSDDEDDSDLDDDAEDDYESEFFLEENGIFTIPPAMVKKINKALVKVTDDELLAAVKSDRKKHNLTLRKSEHKNILFVVETLKSAYQLAASKNSYIVITVLG